MRIYYKECLRSTIDSIEAGPYKDAILNVFELYIDSISSNRLILLTTDISPLIRYCAQRPELKSLAMFFVVIKLTDEHARSSCPWIVQTIEYALNAHGISDL